MNWGREGRTSVYAQTQCFTSYFFFFFTESLSNKRLYQLFFFSFSFSPSSTGTLLHFTSSVCACLHVSSSPSLSLYFLLSLSLLLWLSPRGHRGQACCRGLVDKCHVRPFHVFSGRVELYLVAALQCGAALFSVVLKVSLHF